MSNQENQLIKLNTSEHNATRAIWEEVFREDTKDFLDYYYNNIGLKNHIYVAKRRDEMIAMLHINPYEISVYEEMYHVHYIVAVATLQQYRKQGIMGELLKKSLNDMYDRKEVFSYLMPAAEAIYSPYNFVTVYEQEHYSYEGKERFLNRLNFEFQKSNLAIQASYIQADEVSQVVTFAEEELEGRYNLFTNHSESYIMQLIEEQHCQNGGIVVIKQGEEIIGYCYTAKEEVEQVRECIIRKEFTEIQNILDNILALKDKTRIMIRPIHIETYLNAMVVDKKLGTKISVMDTIIQRNTGMYEVKKIDEVYRFVKVQEEIDECQIYTVEDIVKWTIQDKKIILNEIV